MIGTQRLPPLRLLARHEFLAMTLLDVCHSEEMPGILSISATSWYQVVRPATRSGPPPLPRVLQSPAKATRVTASAAARQHRRFGKLSAGPNYHPLYLELFEGTTQHSDAA
jgi:hypothetical protein